MNTPIILDGKKTANLFYEATKKDIVILNDCGIYPKLTIVTTGDDGASKVYVNNKVKSAQNLGIETEVLHYDYLTHSDFEAIVSSIKNPTIFQLPINGDIDEYAIATSINDKFDADGFSVNNQYELMIGNVPMQYPCTPLGIMCLLGEYNIDVAGKHVVILGRSNIVGKPLAHLMENADATVTLCHSKTNAKTLCDALWSADIIVSAVGKIDTITYESFAHDTVLDNSLKEIINCIIKDKVFIDVGINRDSNGKLCGDINKEILEHSYAYTPVPGGVGPMTVAMLIGNVINGYC